MKIFLTKESKQKIEDKIAEFEEDRQFWLKKSIENIGNASHDSLNWSINQATANQASSLLREILSLATILPVEESWEDVRNHNTEYSQGVIIQSKQ
jgi:hypothetical protein